MNPRGYLSTTVYDTSRNVIAKIDALGRATTTIYDSYGRVAATQDALGHLTTTVYDVYGRTVAAQNAIGNRSTVVYDTLNRRYASIDALGNRSTNVYDALGRTIANINALSNRTSFAYDSASRLVAMTDANSHVTTTIYDAINRILATQDPLGALTSYAYDSANNLIKRIDARSLTTTYSYDADDRETGYIYNDGSRATFTYDSLGRHTLMSDWTGITSYSYDSDSQQTSISYPIGKTLTYAYDANGNRVQLVDPDGGSTIYSYDPLDQLVQISNPLAEITTIAYDPLSREIRRIMTNGLVTGHVYDTVGNESLLQQTTAAGTMITGYTATYDAVGNRLTVLEVDGTVTTYAYDPTYQMTSEQRSGTVSIAVSYTYDPLGNPLTSNMKYSTTDVIHPETETSYEYNAANALILLTTNGVQTARTYDANGNLAQENANGSLATYTWDGENRLIQYVSSTDVIQTATYDATGMRSKLVTGDGVTLFVYDGDNVLQEVNSSGVTQAQYTDSPGIWGGLISMRRNGSSYFYGFDLAGNTRIVTNSAVTNMNSYYYDAFGWETSNGLGIILAVPGNYFLYGGQYGYRQDETGLLYVRARYYDSTNGLWISRDPEWFGAGDWNLYRYVGNNPLTNVDPSGLGGSTTLEPPTKITPDPITPTNPPRNIITPPPDLPPIGLGTSFLTGVGCIMLFFADSPPAGERRIQEPKEKCTDEKYKDFRDPSGYKFDNLGKTIKAVTDKWNCPGSWNSQPAKDCSGVHYEKTCYPKGKNKGKNKIFISILCCATCKNDPASPRGVETSTRCRYKEH
jgi:RHS repeat-associated protein